MTPSLIVDAFIEIPTGSQNKYEYQPEDGTLRLDRVLHSPMHYPAEYGFIPGTLAEDGDPLDILVMVTSPTFPGCQIRSRIVGVLHMRDEKGKDEKLLGVPVHDPRFEGIRALSHVPKHICREIEHFFQVYKDLEGKMTYMDGWEDATSATHLYEACRGRFKEKNAP
ncbi:inorganic diphosphatase [Pasteuria penetrans]|uniref:inorganic diphosphatase n=1 Tax=Pasteuria penetrans TaxID=86005 RepID=UPI000F91E03B|nr:inorganic diphosphatase [Pasteuria penetrans]